MDDFETAISIIFDESGNSNSVLKAQAAAYLQRIKESPTICSICIQKFCITKFVEVQFWCLQCLHETLRFRYSSMTAEEKDLIRKSAFLMACGEPVHSNDVNSARLSEKSPFIKNKLAQVVVTLISFEYPEFWPSVFVDFLPKLSKGSAVIDMFCRILNVMDDELISLDYHRNGDDVAVAGKIKDAMREQCVPQIVSACYNIVLMYRNSDPDLCSSVLNSMKKYVSWIDIRLIDNDAFPQLLFELMLVNGYSDQLQAAASRVVRAVVSKRMDVKLKLALLQKLQISRVFKLVTADNGSELVSGLAFLLTDYAAEVLECYKSLKPGNGKEISLELLNEVLPSVFIVIQNDEVDSKPDIVPVLSLYVGTMKNKSTLTNTQRLHLGQILEVIRTKIQFDPMYRNNLDMLDKIGQQEEDRMTEFRKELFALIHNVGRVAPYLTLSFINNSFASFMSSSGDRNVEEVEASLSLFYALGESLSEYQYTMKTGNGLLVELVAMLLTTRFPCHSNRLVANAYLDTIARYIKFVSEKTHYIPIALHAFLDERGIHHPNVNVGRRASYLFMRVVKMLKAKLVPYTETILQSLQDTVAQFTRMGSVSNSLSGSEDGSHIFEAIGLLIGMEDVPLEKQSDCLSSLLTPLCQQVEAVLLNAKPHNPEESFPQMENMQQIVMAINALSKGFSQRLVTTTRPGIGLMFKKTLDILLQILVVFPKVKPLRSKVTSFIHRMVDTLGPSIFPCLPNALGQLLIECEPKELVDFLVLLNQLICKFSVGVRDILEAVYPVIASKAFNILPRNEIQSGTGSCAEEIRELQELQKTFSLFLNNISTHELSSVFLSPESSSYLGTMMHLLLYNCCNHKDILIRKACVQVFIMLIRDWCADPYGKEKVPGFQKFIIETFAVNCCLYSVLDKSFDSRDANTMLLFSEIVTAQKVMYEKFGNDFVLHFVSKCLPSIHCPQDLAEQYYQKLQDNDLKALKSFYQSLIQILRPLQNGVLVFR